MTSIEIEKNLKTYQGKRAMKISRSFPAGSITKIYGPSGVGKTTFLKIIAGLIAPESGKIVVNGRMWLDTVAGISLPPQKRMAGFVFQDYALFPNMTVRQHLEYATDDVSWVDRLLAIAKLDTLCQHKPEHLSGGQQQRLAILRALAIKPKLLLMDEPFSALDAETKKDLINELKIIFRELGSTVIIVTHNPQELDDLTTSGLLIE